MTRPAGSTAAGGRQGARRTTGPTNRRSPATRLALAVTLAVATVLLTVGAPAGAAPVQDDADPPAASAGLRVTAQDLEVEPDGDYRVAVDVTNAPAGSDLAVQIYDRIEDPDALAASATDEPSDLLATFDPLPLAETEAAAQPSGFTIYLYGPGEGRPSDVPANWAYRLDEAGVYPIEVRLRGPDGEELTSIVTYLVRRPDAEADAAIVPTAVALLATVHQDPPEPTVPSDSNGLEAADGEPVDPAYALALADVLAVFADRPALPLTFDVTPDVVARLQADPDAVEVLTALRTEVGRPSRQLTGAPYVDVDVASLVDNGLRDEVTRQRDYGNRTLLTSLTPPDGWPGQDTWVVDRPVDAAAVGTLADLGVAHLVLPADALAGPAPSNPFPLPSSSGPVDAVTTASEDLASGTTADPVLAAYQLLGRLAATASIRPGGTVTALPIDPEAVDATQLATVLDVLAAPSTYLRATTLAGVFAESPAAEPAPPLVTPDTIDLGTYPALVDETYQSLGSYASMLTGSPELVAAFEQPLARSASVDLDLATRRAAVQRRLEAIRGRLGAIDTPEIDQVTLGARNANFPLPITSTSGDPVRVLITLDASDRLSFPNDTIEATLDGPRTVVQIPVETRATGDTPLRITIRTPDGATVLADSRYTVRSTAVSGVGLLLTVGAAGFLALWWGRNWRRSRRPPGRPVGAAGSAPAGSSAGRATDDTLAAAVPGSVADDDDLFVAEPVDVTGWGDPRSKAD